jgi:nucleoside-diphosphate-sugar epimerase
MKILLTGISGFIGSAFARLALSRGHQLAGLLRPNKPIPGSLPASSNLVWLRGLLADAPWKEIEAFGAEACVHTAWVTTPGVYLESPENERFRDASLRFARKLRELGTEHFVGLGTCIEYLITGEPLSEDHTPIAPTTLYARCKNELRLGLEAEAKASGSVFCWARVFYPYGPGEHPSRLCSAIVEKLARGARVVLKTPDITKDYIYVEDLASALLTVVEQRHAGAINLGTGAGITVRAIANHLARLLAKPDLIAAASQPEPDPFPFVVADVAKLKAIGWQPAYGLEQGLEKFVKAWAGPRRWPRTLRSEGTVPPRHLATQELPVDETPSTC